MKVRFAVVCAVAFVCGYTNAPAAAHAASPPFRHVRFAQAPKDVQQDLVDQLTECETSAKMIRSYARFDIGPVTGPGAKDYVFDFNVYWMVRGGWFSPIIPTCAWGGENIPIEFWMRQPDGRYDPVVLRDALIYAKPSGIVVATRPKPCDGSKISGNIATWDCYDIVAWDRKSGTFRSIVTSHMTLDQTGDWARARGYRAYRHPRGNN